MKKLRKASIVLMAVLTAAIGFGSIQAQADDGTIPKKVSIKKSSITVMAGEKFEVKANVSPRNSDDDYLRWEIVSGKEYVKFIDKDLADDDIKFKAKKAGKAKIRCYIKGKNKKKYGDTITIYVKKSKESGKYTISKVGETTKIIEEGDDFELKVKKSSAIKNNQLKWQIADSSIVRFDDNDHFGKIVEFKAEKSGTTKITCICKKAKPEKITYTIKVVPDPDDLDNLDDD